MFLRFSKAVDFCKFCIFTHVLCFKSSRMNHALPLVILMNSPIHIDTRRMGSSIMHIKGS